VDGTAAVTDTAIVSFYFNKNLPFNTDFISGFTFAEPRRLLSVRGVLLDLDAQGRPRIARFTVAHRAKTDFAWVVYGIESARGEMLAEPFVLNYSTTDLAGSRQASGSVHIEAEQPAVVASSIPDYLPEMLEVASFGRVDPYAFALAEHSTGKRTAISTTDLQTAEMSIGGLTRTVVLLLSEYSIDDRSWAVRSAGKVQSDGAFHITTARSERLHPVAIRFRDNDNRTIEAFGFHDPDGTGVAQAIDLRDDDASDIRIRMYAYEHRTFSAAIARASEGVERFLGSPGMITGAWASGIDPAGGHAGMWTLDFSDGESSHLQAVVDPISVRLFGAEDSPTRVFVAPHDVMDSNELILRAEASGGADFRAEHSEGATISMRLGSSESRVRPREDIFWTVTYRSATGDSLAVYLHPVTGDLLDTVDTGGEEMAASVTVSLHPNYPNPFVASTTVSFDLDRRADVTLSVYDLQGRRVMDSSLGLQPSGRHEQMVSLDGLPSGLYMLRLTVNGIYLHRALTLVRN
jgi:hypothetical protein